MCIIHFPYGTGIIFIHIPKTGGSSIENYFKDKYHLTHKEMYIGGDPRIPHSIHHSTWKEYCEHWNTVFDGDARDRANYEVFTVVRNPYTRLISDFYWWLDTYENLYREGIPPPVVEMPPDEITIEYMETFLENMLIDLTLENEKVAEGTLYDTHPWQQCRFLNGAPPRTKILRQETLTEQMRADARFCDFDTYDNVLPKPIPYIDLLTPKIISMVNSVYARDFELFGYEMLDPEKDGAKQPADIIVWKRPFGK